MPMYFESITSTRDNAYLAYSLQNNQTDLFGNCSGVQQGEGGYCYWGAFFQASFMTHMMGHVDMREDLVRRQTLHTSSPTNSPHGCGPRKCSSALSQRVVGWIAMPATRWARCGSDQGGWASSGLEGHLSGKERTCAIKQNVIRPSW